MIASMFIALFLLLPDSLALQLSIEFQSQPHNPPSYKSFSPLSGTAFDFAQPYYVPYDKQKLRSVNEHWLDHSYALTCKLRTNSIISLTGFFSLVRAYEGALRSSIGQNLPNIGPRISRCQRIRVNPQGHILDQITLVGAILPFQLDFLLSRGWIESPHILERRKTISEQLLKTSKFVFIDPNGPIDKSFKIRKDLMKNEIVKFQRKTKE
jgi:hypothetical protein